MARYVHPAENPADYIDGSDGKVGKQWNAPEVITLAELTANATGKANEAGPLTEVLGEKPSIIARFIGHLAV